MKTDDVISDYCDKIATPIVKRLAAVLRGDLYSGPLYFDKYGEESACFDSDAEGLHQFDFGRACGILEDWIDRHIDAPLYVDMDCEDVSTRESEGFEDDDGEWIEPDYSSVYQIERRDILRAWLGNELAACL